MNVLGVIFAKGQERNLEIILSHLSKWDKIIIVNQTQDKIRNKQIIEKKSEPVARAKARNILLKTIIQHCADDDNIVIGDGDIITQYDLPLFIAVYQPRHNEIVYTAKADIDDLKDNSFFYERPCLNVKVDTSWHMFYSTLFYFKASLLKYNIFFDENFVGWGLEDNEWAYRLALQDIKFSMNIGVIAWHLKHKSNYKPEEYYRNGLYFFNKYKDKEIIDFVLNGLLNFGSITYAKKFLEEVEK